jgi:hypothetical protein
VFHASRWRDRPGEHQLRVSPNATAPCPLDKFRFGNSLTMHHFRAIDALAHGVDDETMLSRTNARHSFDR